jgi:lipopolysaccharide export system protein LptC
MNQLAAISEFEHADAQVFAISSRADDDRTFRAAVRHSRRVRFLRVAIPASVGVVVLGGMVAAAILQPLRVLAKVPIELSSLVVSGTKITMQAPRLKGYTNDNRHYDLTAQAAAQDITKPDFVELKGIRANMDMRDQISYEMTAKTGLYNSRTEVLTLQQNVVVTSSGGYHARLAEAVVEVRSGKITSEKPVEVKSAQWTVSANALEVIDSGAVIRFDRGVTMTLLTPGESASLTGSRERRTP